MARPGTLYIAAATVAVLITQGTAQFQACYDSAAANCGGNVISSVSTAEECCLGNGFWFRDPNLGGCVQCIVHGFERSMVSVNEGDMQETFRIRMDIKGNTLDELPQFQVTRINFTVVCDDVTTESDDYSSATCDSQSVTRLNLNDPGMMDAEVRITFQADNRALEGIEELRLSFQLERGTQDAVTTSGNIFFQNVSIQINDTTALRPTFSQVDYEGNEGPDRGSNLAASPCNVLVRLEGTIIEEDLTIRLIPRTFEENVAVNGPPPTAERLGSNASRADFNDTQPFEVTIPAGTTAASGAIPIVDDEINEGAQEFVVVLEVASVTTNPVDFSGSTQIQTTVCRIPANDPIEIGFRQPTVTHDEEERLFSAILEKDRPSELEYVVDIVVSTPNTGDGRAATPDVDFELGGTLVIGTVQFRVAPTQDSVAFSYRIFEDNIPENTELIQLSSSSNELPTFLCDDDPMFRFNGRDCFRDLQIRILDDDVVVVGFVETLVEVDESDGRATLNVSISDPPPDPLLQFEIEFTLLANTVDGSAGSRSTAATRRDPIPGVEDYQQIVNLALQFNDAQRSQTFSVTIFEDAVPEDVEELTVTLILDPTSVGIVGERVNVTPAVATVRILDNDRLVVGFERTTYAVNEGGGQVELCVIVIQPADQEIGDVTFNLTVETQDGTAVGSGVDYISVNTTLATFTDDQPRQCFNVTIVDDTAVESTEDFFASLTLIPASVTTIDPSRITVAPAQASVNITDNDLTTTPPPTTPPPTTPPPTTPPPPTQPFIRVNDTVTGDPLMTVPLNVGESTRMLLRLSEGEHVSLCYEVHGEANENFNLVSDVCVSVNAHYMRARSDVDINIIDTIGVRAVGNDNQCRNIRVDLDGCRASVNGMEITMPYRMAGISVRKYTNRVRIAVPNCDDHDLVMWVFCLNNTFTYRTVTFQSPMIRFVIARGLNLQETSHGIIGQFWNIPIDVVRYNQSYGGTVSSDAYTITVNYPNQRRQFVGLLYQLTWELDYRQCLYVGNRQGGPIDEVSDPNDPVLQGEYQDYEVGSLFGTAFEYGHFDDSRCP